MAMVLEYPANLLIITAVVIVLLGIMLQFRDKITNICFFPPCKQQPRCDVKTISSTENNVNKDTLEKYCRICWEKNEGGECSADAICYAVNTTSCKPSDFYPLMSPNVKNYCKVECARDVTSFLVKYDHINNVTITC